MPDSALAAAPNRIDPRWRSALWVVPVVSLALVLIAAVRPEPQPNPLEFVTIGLVFGSFFGQAILAAAWTALGPLPLILRLPLALLWLAASVAALAINLSSFGPPGNSEVVIVFAGAAFGQWFLAQIPLWGLAVGYGLRIRHTSETGPAQGRGERQFGIGQLMIVTAIVAVVLGIARAIIAALAFQAPFEARPLFIVSFLAVAGIIMIVPLVLAALLPRHALPASLLVLVLIALGTAAELPLLISLNPTAGGGPQVWHFYGISGFQCFWVLAVTGVLRCAGYRLAAAK